MNNEFTDREKDIVMHALIKLAVEQKLTKQNPKEMKKKFNAADERELLSPPGDTILETLTENNVTAGDLAEQMGITQVQMDGLIAGKEPITEQIALRLEVALDIPAHFWLNREKLYREKLKWIEEHEKSKK